MLGSFIVETLLDKVAYRLYSAQRLQAARAARQWRPARTDDGIARGNLRRQSAELRAPPGFERLPVGELACGNASQRGPRARIGGKSHRGDSVGAQLRVGSRANLDVGLRIALREHVHSKLGRARSRIEPLRRALGATGLKVDDGDAAISERVNAIGSDPKRQRREVHR